jgi:hypothetical protein
MFDLHLIHILNNAIKYYATSRELFDPLFPNISDAMRQRMFQALQTNKVSFDTAFAQRKASSFPIITVENNEQFYDSQALGDSSGVLQDNFGRKVMFNHIFTSQEAVINILAETQEQVRMYQAIIQAAMLIFKPYLFKAGYENLLYIGSTQLEAEPMLLEKGSAAYSRQCRYAALHHTIIPVHLDSVAEVGASLPDYQVVINNHGGN